MTRGYLAMCCETVLTQDNASSYNNRAVTFPGTRCMRESSIYNQYLHWCWPSSPANVIIRLGK